MVYGLVTEGRVTEIGVSVTFQARTLCLGKTR